MTLVYNRARFMLSAFELADCPPDTGREVAFVGRSNSGKSRALNALTGRKQLARTSKQPGRTQSINFFEIQSERRLVDLPGYGYAKVSKQMQRHWDTALGRFLEARRALRGVVITMDVRHPLTDLDWLMLDLLRQNQRSCHIVLSKSDKLSTQQGRRALANVTDALTNEIVEPFRPSVQLFSAVTRSGLDELVERIDQWLAGPADEHF